MDEYKIFTLLDDIIHNAEMITFVIKHQHSERAKDFLPELKQLFENLVKELDK